MIELILGGSGSGKSAYGENQITNKKNSLEEGKMYYLATMHSYDKESDKRIERHRMLREGKGFETLERETFLDWNFEEIQKMDICLLEDLSNLLANEKYIGSQKELFGAVEQSGVHSLLEKILELGNRCRALYIVSNDIFLDGREYEEETMNFMKELAYLNRELANNADAVTEVVAGIPISHK